MRARALAVIGVALLPVTAPQEAGAREEATRGVVDSVEPTGKVASDLGFVVMPIPQSNPTVGTGLILPLLLLYRPRRERPAVDDGRRRHVHR